MRSLRTSAAISGVALLMISGAGCGKILSKAAKEGVKAATHGSVDIGNHGVKFHDSDGNTCEYTVGDSSGKAVCTDKNGKTVAQAGVDSNGKASGSITDSNGDTCSGTLDSDTGVGHCVDSNGDTTATAHADTDTAGVTITDSNDSTSFSSGTGSKLPKDWPSEANPPNGADVQLSVKNTDSSEVVFTAKSTSVDKVFGDLDSHLKSAGWSRTSNSEINGNKVAEYTKGDQTATVSVSKSGTAGDVTGTIAINKTNN